MISSILLLLASNTMTMGHETIELNCNNVLTIRGTITEDNVNDFVFDLNKMENKQDIYVYLDTNGGSVHAGIKVVSEVQKHNISCIAHRAYSMGFVILQSCAKRYVTPYATVMQHQISYGASSEKAKVESYVNFVDQVGDQLDKMQSDKIGLCVKDFTQKTYNDWWLAGDNILSENVADKIVHVTCTKELTESNYTKDGFFGEIVYSRCPLVSNPIN